jgi:hypothetical protein
MGAAKSICAEVTLAALFFASGLVAPKAHGDVPPLVRVGLIAHRTSAVIGSPGPFVVCAGENEWQ